MNGNGAPVAVEVFIVAPFVGADIVTLNVFLLSTLVSATMLMVIALLSSLGAKLIVPLGRSIGLGHRRSAAVPETRAA